MRSKYLLVSYRCLRVKRSWQRRSQQGSHSSSSPSSYRSTAPFLHFCSRFLSRETLTLSQLPSQGCSEAQKRWGAWSTEKLEALCVLTEHPQNSWLQAWCGYMCKHLSNIYTQALSIVHMQGKGNLPQVVTIEQKNKTKKYGEIEV